MAFHEAFWVAAAAASPVIGLTHVVSVNRQARRVVGFLNAPTTEELPASLTRRQRVEPLAATGHMLVLILCIVASVYVLFDSLTALSLEKDGNMSLDTKLLSSAMLATLLAYVEIALYAFIDLAQPGDQAPPSSDKR